MNLLELCNSLLKKEFRNFYVFAGAEYTATELGVNVPKTLTSIVTTLKYDYYNKLIEYLSN